MQLRGIALAVLLSFSNVFGVCNPVVCVFGQSVKIRLQKAVELDLFKIQQTFEQNQAVGIALLFEHFVIDPKYLLQVDLEWVVSKVTLTQFDAEGLDDQTVIKIQEFAKYVVLQDALGRWIIPMIDNPSFVRARSIIAQYDRETIQHVSLDDLVQQFLV